jgi:hypothetical protein
MDFGDDTELLAPKVTKQHIQQVSDLTGIRFPSGSEGLAFLYLGSGIDDSLSAKIVIPSDAKSTFLQNEIFQKGGTNSPTFQVGRAKPWWRIDSLSERTDRSLHLGQGRSVECTLGVEDGKLIAYVSWVTM